MAEGMSNDDLQAIVDSYKRAQMERSQADALKHREGRWAYTMPWWGHSVYPQHKGSEDKGGYSIYSTPAAYKALYRETPGKLTSTLQSC